MTIKGLSAQEVNDMRRSKVRPYVTYLLIAIYALTTSFVIIWLLLNDQADNALALLSGLSAVSTGIVGFWFGTRGNINNNITNPSTIDKPFLQVTKTPLEKVTALLTFHNKTLNDLIPILDVNLESEVKELLNNSTKLTEKQKVNIAALLKSSVKNIFG